MPRFGQPGAPARGPGRPKKPKQEYIPPPNDGAPALLQVMRHVYSNPKEYDVTEEQRAIRRFKDRHIVRFMKQYLSMEAKYRR